MNITSNKTYQVGEKLICILQSNSYLEVGKEYTVSKVEDWSGRIHLKEEEGYRFNPARFISVQEFRESKLNNLLDNE